MISMKHTLCCVAAFGVLCGGYFPFQKWPDIHMPWKTAGKADAAKESPRPTTAVVTVRNICVAISTEGEITAVDQVSVRPEVSGQIREIPVDIGDKVKKGDILFTLDDRDLQTEKAQRQIEIEGAKLGIDGSRMTLEKVERNFNRHKELCQNKLVALDAFENARDELAMARNSVAVRMNTIEALQKTLQIVEDKLAKTKITAPFDCTILTRPVSVGQAVSGASGVNSGTEVLTIADLSELIVNAHISQADVARMTINQRVQIEIEAVAGLKLFGRVDRIAPQVTARSGIKGLRDSNHREE